MAAQSCRFALASAVGVVGRRKLLRQVRSANTSSSDAQSVTALSIRAQSH